MDDIMREKVNVGPTLNFNERLYRQSLNKKFDTCINKSAIFNALKDKQCSIPIDVFISRKSLWREKKLVLSQNIRSHNLETFEHNQKKFGT